MNNESENTGKPFSGIATTPVASKHPPHEATNIHEKKICADKVTSFLTATLHDNRINTRHISLYLALLSCWYDYAFQQPLTIRREGLMPLAKISGLATYHKCIRELHDYGYIRYVPSFHPGIPSRVYFV